MSAWAQVGTEPPALRYVGAQRRSVEYELDLGSQDFMEALVDGVPLPEPALRWIALWSVRESFDRVYVGARRERELARVDAAITIVDCRVYLGAEVFVDDEGQAESAENVYVSWTPISGRGGEHTPIEKPSAWLLDWIETRATEEIQKEP